LFLVTYVSSLRFILGEDEPEFARAIANEAMREGEGSV
jgi:hypothetical protein